VSIGAAVPRVQGLPGHRTNVWVVDVGPVVENVHLIHIPGQPVIAANYGVAAQAVAGQLAVTYVEPAHHRHHQITVGPQQQIGVVASRLKNVLNRMYRNYKGPFRRSSQAIWASYRPLSCWGTRLYAAPLLSWAGPMDWANLQTDDPEGECYLDVVTDRPGVRLKATYSFRGDLIPWNHQMEMEVVEGCLEAGDHADFICGAGASPELCWRAPTFALPEAYRGVRFTRNRGTNMELIVANAGIQPDNNLSR